jgi:hypothetical protein
MGATEKRRESGAGVSLDTYIGDLESVKLGGGGVYQEWGVVSLAASTAIGNAVIGYVFNGCRARV